MPATFDRRALGFLFILIAAGALGALFFPRRSTPPRAYLYSLGRKASRPVLTIEKVDVVFEAIPFPGPDAPVLAKASIQVSGPGRAQGSETVSDFKLETAYADGVQTLHAGGATLTIRDGVTLEAGDLRLPLASSASLVVGKDGSVRRAP